MKRAKCANRCPFDTFIIWSIETIPRYLELVGCAHRTWKRTTRQLENAKKEQPIELSDEPNGCQPSGTSL